MRQNNYHQISIFFLLYSLLLLGCSSVGQVGEAFNDKENSITMKSGWNSFVLPTSNTNTLLMVEYDNKRIDLDAAIKERIVDSNIYSYDAKTKKLIKNQLSKSYLFVPDITYYLDVDTSLKLVPVVFQGEIKNINQFVRIANDKNIPLICSIEENTPEMGELIIKSWRLGNNFAMYQKRQIGELTMELKAITLGKEAYVNFDYLLLINKVFLPKEEGDFNDLRSKYDCIWVKLEKPPLSIKPLEVKEFANVNLGTDLKCTSGGFGEEVFTVSGKICDEKTLLEDIKRQQK